MLLRTIKISFEFKRVSGVKVSQSCLTLCNPMDCTVHGILQARILEWVAFPVSRGSSRPRNRTRVSCIAGIFFTSWATREALEFKSSHHMKEKYSSLKKKKRAYELSFGARERHVSRHHWNASVSNTQGSISASSCSLLPLLSHTGERDFLGIILLKIFHLLGNL